MGRVGVGGVKAMIQRVLDSVFYLTSLYVLLFSPLLFMFYYIYGGGFINQMT